MESSVFLHPSCLIIHLYRSVFICRSLITVCFIMLFCLATVAFQAYSRKRAGVCSEHGCCAHAQSSSLLHLLAEAHAGQCSDRCVWSSFYHPYFSLPRHSRSLSRSHCISVVVGVLIQVITAERVHLPPRCTNTTS